MIPSRFSKEISSWIPISVIAQEAVRYQLRPIEANTKNRLFLRSDTLLSGMEANLVPLIRRYVEHFRIPSEVLELLPVLIQGAIPEQGIEKLTKLRFTGKVESLYSAQSDDHGLRPVVAITDKDATLNILRWPLMMLADSASTLAPNWRQAREMGLNVFLRHTYNSALGVFLESRVAEYYGFSADAALESHAGEAIINNYRAITFVIDQQPDKGVIESARSSAFFDAEGSLL